MTDDPTGAPEPDRRAAPVLDGCGLRIEPPDSADTDHDPADDLPWGADDPHPPAPTGDADEVPVQTDPTPYTLGPWERDGAWSWVRCWTRPGDPGRPVAASVSTVPQCGEWEVLAHLPSGTERRYVSRGRAAVDAGKRAALDLLRAAWPDLTRPATDFGGNNER